MCRRSSSLRPTNWAAASALDVTLNIVFAACGLVAMMGAAEILVRQLTTVGDQFALRGATLGFLVALGADAPEISSAVIALASGSQSIGIGVVEGSNIYNLAGLLGLSAMVVGTLTLRRAHVLREAAMSVAITALVVALVFVSGWWRTPIALVAIAGTVAYFLGQTSSDGTEKRDWRLGLRPMGVAIVAALALVGASFLLIHGVESIVREGGVPSRFMGLLALPVATSIPNTWAAISLARQGRTDAVIATVFNSNLINLSIGVAFTSLIIDLRASHLATIFDGPYLFGMTLLTAILLLTSNKLSRLEGGIVIAMYLSFLVLRMFVLSA